MRCLYSSELQRSERQEAIQHLRFSGKAHRGNLPEAEERRRLILLHWFSLFMPWESESTANVIREKCFFEMVKSILVIGEF